MKEITKRSFDEINEVESWLYTYKSVKAAIGNLKLESDSDNLCVVSSADPSKEGAKTNKFNSVVENTITKNEMLKDRIKHMEIKMKQLDNALESLNEDEANVIRLFYIDGKRYYEISPVIRNSESTCKRIRRRAIKKIVIAMFGV